MKITDVFDKPKVERDSRTGDIIPACVGLKHWWYYVGPSVQKCKTCGAVRMAPR